MEPDGRHENSNGGESEPPTPAPPKIPDHELIRCIGRGAFGEVWLARATSLTGAYRAVKIVRRDSLQGEGFLREFKAVQKFEPISRGHPNLVHILHVGESAEADGFFYVMELADDANAGEDGAAVGSAGLNEASYEPRSLQGEVGRRGRLPFGECLETAVSLACGLTHLHRHGLLHRDIKPANIIFVHGAAKLADIGLVADAKSAPTFVGTEGFIPPEGPGTPQADVFGLGKVFYEMLTGLDRTFFPQLPEGWEDQPNLKARQDFNEIIQRACEADARRRYQTAEALRDDLWQLQRRAMAADAGGGRKKRAVVRMAGLAAVGLALATGAFFIYQLNKSRVRSARTPVPAAGLTTEEASAGFVALFNGKDLDGWNAPGGNWACRDGALTRVAGGGDITYEAQPMPDNFDLHFEWKVSPGADSGVIYRDGSVQYQVLDNDRSPLGANPQTWAGALFDYASEPKDRTKRVGQWNEGRILCEGERIRHYLNRSLVLDTSYNQPEWEEARNRLKEKYGADLNARGGYLVLRDEKGQVWYRNIRLKKLE